MNRKPKEKFFRDAAFSCILLFLPLMIMAGRLATRVVLNLWNMIES